MQGRKIDRASGLLQPDFRAPECLRPVGRQCEGCAAELDRIDAKQQMMHDRVADEGRVENVLGRDPRFGRRIGDQSINRLADSLGQLGVAARIHHGVGDPAHQVLAEADLRVHDSDRRDDLSGRKVGQVGGHGCRTDIVGKPVGLVAKSRPDRDDPLSPVNRDGRRPVAVAKNFLQPLQGPDVALEFAETPLVP